MQFIDLKAQYQALKTEIDGNIAKVLEHGRFISGPEVKTLEEKLAAYVGVKHCITCANGTDALELVLYAWGIGQGDAVFVPSFTFMSTGEVVAYLGATPVFVDIDLATFNMDVNSLEAAILKVQKEGRFTPKAVIPVDLFGQCANYDAIIPIAQKYGLLVLEDGAQGFGGSIRGKRACSFGDAATTSFFPAKPLGCYGDGGAIFTEDDELAELLRSLVVHGKGAEKYDNVRIGRNSRLDTIQAAILLPKLKALEEYEIDWRNRWAAMYSEKLSGHVATPYVPEGYVSSWAQYTIRLKEKTERETMQERLREVGIPSMVYYAKGLHQQEAFRGCRQYVDYPNTEMVCKQVLSLPMHAYLEEKNVEKTCEIIMSKMDFVLI